MHYSSNMLAMAAVLAMGRLSAVSAVAADSERRTVKASPRPTRAPESPLAGFGERQRRRHAERQRQK